MFSYVYTLRETNVQDDRIQEMTLPFKEKKEKGVLVFYNFTSIKGFFLMKEILKSNKYFIF